MRDDKKRQRDIERQNKRKRRSFESGNGKAVKGSVNYQSRKA